MKSPFQLLLLNRNNNRDPAERTNDRPLSKVKYGGGSVSAGTTSSQSSSTRNGTTNEDDGGRSHTSSHGSAWANYRKSFRIVSYQGRHPNNLHHYRHHTRHHAANNNMIYWSSNQSVHSLQEDASTADGSTAMMHRVKQPSSSSHRRMVLHTAPRHDELAATCLSVGATIDFCMKEDSGFLLVDALAAYACGYDDDDEEEDDIDEDVDEKRDDGPTVYETFFQIGQGALTASQVPPQDPLVKETKDSHEESQETTPAPPTTTTTTQPETIKLLTAAPEDDGRDEDDSPREDIPCQVEFQQQETCATTCKVSTDLNVPEPVESQAVTETGEGDSATDDSSGTSSTSTLQDGQQLVKGEHQNNSSFAQYLLQAFALVTCQELEWSQGQDDQATTTLLPSVITNAANPSNKLTESDLSNLEQGIPASSTLAASPEQVEIREKKSLFSRRGRFGSRGGRSRRRRQIKPKTLLSNETVIHSSEQTRTSQGMDLAPEKINTTSSAIVTTLVPTIVESASC